MKNNKIPITINPASMMQEKKKYWRQDYRWHSGLWEQEPLKRDDMKPN